MENILSSMSDHARRALVEEVARRTAHYFLPLELANMLVSSNVAVQSWKRINVEQVTVTQSVNMPPATTAANETNPLLRLPVEILNMITSSITDMKDIGAFRLTCRKIGHCDGSQASLFHESGVSMHPTSVFKLNFLARDSIRNRFGELQDSSK